MLCFSRPCCSIFDMISCSLLPLTCQSQFFGPTSEHLKLTLPSFFGWSDTLGFILSSRETMLLSLPDRSNTRITLVTRYFKGARLSQPENAANKAGDQKRAIQLANNNRIVAMQYAKNVLIADDNDALRWAHTRTGCFGLP